MHSDNDRMIPDAVSHRTLMALHQAADQEVVAESNRDELAGRLNATLLRWSEDTKNLLESMASNPEQLGSNRTARQVMALGSFRTHLMLGLQALQASQS